MTSITASWTKVRQEEGFVSVFPLPSLPELQAFYAQQYYQQSASASYQQAYSDLELDYKRMQARLMLHAIDQSGERAGTLLDVGCGEGFLLAEAARQNLDVSGIDFSAHAIERFHPELRKTIEIGDAFALLDNMMESGRRFDACVLQNVLEHVIDPRGLLDRLRQLLTPSGRLLITLPNDYSRVQQVAMDTGAIETEYWFSPPQHLHYFTIAAAAALAASRGLAVLDTFADFPIEAYLFHPGSNYVRQRCAGPDAHKARMIMSLICAESGMDAYLTLSRAYAGCGVGRAFTMILGAKEASR
ncbi:class I SAM-dependent methyltransferase [Undibacter mobilis]|uniref:Class I SAM-dependent methyltransferase n=1 Tax=Undibacter mobilis TaxID=2292256 RepID=A0A371B6M8_9BRAD|nr:class I SAM-dependent methyltransferase [Undibacter mobilis]RDV03172.1 class I SAM-dependent methyltransferase [Undibacter mobilis]